MVAEKVTERRKRSTIVLGLLGVVWLVLGGVVLQNGYGRAPTIRIAWATETEFDTAGFNVYRSDREDGEFVQINSQLIPSTADPSAGAEYLFVDENVELGRTYFYRLEDVEYDNSREQHEVFSGAAEAASWETILLAGGSFLVGIILIFTTVRDWRRP